MPLILLINSSIMSSFSLSAVDPKIGTVGSPAPKFGNAFSATNTIFGNTFSATNTIFGNTFSASNHIDTPSTRGRTYWTR